MKKNKIKEFFATSWAIDNRSSIYVLVALITVLGVINYRSLPKEQLPDVVIPTIMVNTIYPGTSPSDMENLVTRPIEKQLKAVSSVKNVSSTSVQDFSSIIIEFNTNVDQAEAKQKVRDAIDKAKSQLPTDLYKDPEVIQIDFAEMPIMNIQISGNYDLERLKKYAEMAQDRIESLKEITRVDIVGALDREIQVNIDMYKMQIAGVSMYDVEKAISYENHTISAGEISMDGMKRNVRITGEFKNIDDIGNIVLLSTIGGKIYLKDIADIKDGYKEQESFSRLNGQNVVTLSVIKRGGENLIEGSDKINDIIEDLKKNDFPPDLSVTTTGDISKYTRSTLGELNNTIIFGFILIMFLLMFFMGVTNAFFVGLSVPLSVFVSCLIFPGIDFSMNMIVMFGLVFALGIIVDDAIVVIENTHRHHRFEPDITRAAKSAAGEVFVPILSGTLTTLAPFFPLIFWPGIVGEFMYFLPVTLVIVLLASLFVAYIINPVFAVSFMKHEYDVPARRVDKKKAIVFGVITVVFATLAYLLKWPGIGNFIIFAYLMVLLYFFALKRSVKHFREKTWPWVMEKYEKLIRAVLYRKRPYAILGGTVVLLILTLLVMYVWPPRIVFFADNEPNTISVMITLPVGTDQKVTDSVTRIVEKRIGDAIGNDNPIVESVIANVTNGIAGENFDFDRFPSPNKGKVTVNFVEFSHRNGEETNPYVEKIRDAVKGIPGTQITVVKSKLSPPTGKPVNIEISSENIISLVETAKKFKNHIDSLQIPGIDELKWDFEENKPEILIDIDRVRANREGLSAGQIGSELRTAIFGKEVTKLKQDEDEFPIMVRVTEAQRKDFNRILDQKITYRDMSTFWPRQVPLSSLVKVDYTNSYGGIKRKNFKRVITISSEVLPGYNANEIVRRISNEAELFHKDENVEIKMTGETEFMKESINFLLQCAIIALGLIFFILITQFNSVSKTLIILAEVIFSIIGVLLGIIIFRMEFSVIMTGIGILALGGIVVRNGILIVEFADLLRAKGMKTREAIVQAGKTRITPVLLTATATMLGLVPLAIGMNFDFISLFTELNPHIFFGGDNVMFWRSLSWTIIFGLSFATILTLLIVPAMYLILAEIWAKMQRRKSNKRFRKAQLLAK
ncbi:MAG TPA: efflux RND transporter permease subunit [Bacteroidales bacterium]|nr:efflux RND transporter permease subunit [Bacteroidales bacterium]